MLDYSVERLSNERSIFRLAGRLDAATATTLKDALKGAAAEGAIYLVMDLTQLAFIDSSGLTALVSGFKAVRERHGSLTLVGVGEQVKVALQLTKLDQILPIFPDADSALASMGGSAS
jgi:anti-sigma B factor antagonist